MPFMLRPAQHERAFPTGWPLLFTSKTCMMDVGPHSKSSVGGTMAGEEKPLSTGDTSMTGTTCIPTHYDIFAGLDVDKRRIAVTFTDHQGFIRSLRMPYRVEPLLSYVRTPFADQKIAFAYEAGPTGYGLYDGLAAQAYRCLIAAPAMIPKAPGQRVKTNRLDSRRLSENLRGGQLRSIHVPSPLYR